MKICEMLQTWLHISEQASKRVGQVGNVENDGNDGKNAQFSVIIYDNSYLSIDSSVFLGWSQ